MNTDGKEKKTQNRELVGESIEIIGDQALCQCVNGSVQVPLKVTSQQKFYCNNASRLIATNGDKDGRSLNFGSCKARNDSPCMAMIQWKHFYDKILFGNTLSPLTMKSQGICTFGGTVSFVTSGQQVVVKPPCSVGEARRIVHTNPLFKEEDMKGKTSVKPQRDDAPVEQRVSKAFVTSVRVNGKTYVSPRAHDNGPLVFTNTLTSGADDSVVVKWDVTCNGKDVATGLLVSPPRELFAKEGEYKVFAYVKERGSREGGGYVTVDVSCPTFVSLGWENANGEAVHLVGKRYAVYANLKFKGMGDIPVKARFYFLSGNGKQYLTDYTSLAMGQDGRAKVKLVLTDSQVKQIMDEERSWDMKVLIRVDLASGEWVDGLKRSEESEIEYTDNKDIVSTTLYRDKDCNEEVTGFVECGQTVYAKVITRGFEDGLLTLSVFCHGTVPDNNSAATGYVFKVMGDVDNDGVCIQEIVTEQSWLQGKHSETFDILIIGGYFREDMNAMPLGNENYSSKNTCKTLQMGKDKGILLLCLPKQEIEGGQSKTMVQEVESEKHKCPRCDQDITLDEIKHICVDEKGHCLIEDTAMIAAALPYLNQYRKRVGINTCVSKAHFLAQIAGETKFYQLQEMFKYSDPERMRTIFTSYFRAFGPLSAQQKEAKRLSDLSKNRNNWPEVANSIYGPTHPLGKNHTDKGDGWRYSGKGFKQITWKDGYISLQHYVQKNWSLNINWVGGNNPFALKQSPVDAIVSALAYWSENDINSVAHGLTDQDVDNVTAKINNSRDGSVRIPRRFYFQQAVQILQVKSCLRENNLRNKTKISTFDGKYTAKEGEVYIDVITPQKRDWEGPLIVFDNKEILYTTHSLCRGSNRNRTRKEGSGDTPTGKAVTSYSPDAHKGKLSYGKSGLIYLTGIQGEFLTATKNGRAGIAIHGGHTMGYSKQINDKGMLMSTYGCIRVYNSDMAKLGKLYQQLKKQKKKIYCYIEDYKGDINDVYELYNMSRDKKDKHREKNNRKQ